jgi:hypothetical protein
MSVQGKAQELMQAMAAREKELAALRAQLAGVATGTAGPASSDGHSSGTQHEEHDAQVSPFPSCLASRACCKYTHSSIMTDYTCTAHDRYTLRMILKHVCGLGAWTLWRSAAGQQTCGDGGACVLAGGCPASAAKEHAQRR